jgi:hypothetical protein
MIVFVSTKMASQKGGFVVVLVRTQQRVDNRDAHQLTGIERCEYRGHVVFCPATKQNNTTQNKSKQNKTKQHNTTQHKTASLIPNPLS